MTRKRLTLGREGERLAGEFLAARGYRILARNFRTRCGEVDLIAQRAGTLVFVEVKARSSQVHTFALERELGARGFSRVAGIDEAGRGPLAGPVVAACVVLPEHCEYTQFRDSKLLGAKDRVRLFAALRAMGASIGVGSVSERGIDRLNILQASLQAMAQAVGMLVPPPDFLLVDGRHAIPCELPQRALVRGESHSASVAAASIVAKVVRDGIMADYHRLFPQYNFRKHKGYPTAEHRRCIEEHGPCVLHRRTFRGVVEYLAGTARP